MSDQKQRDAEADLASVAQKCHRCGGDGRLQNDEVCKECLGTGAEYPEALREIAVWWIAEALRMRTVLASIEEYGTEEINTAFELRTALARARAELTRQQVANEDLRAEVARLKQELGDTLVRSHNETARPFDWLNSRPRVVEDYEHKRATLADLQRAIREDPLMNAYYVMFLRGGFASFEDFLINLAFGLSVDRKKLIDALMRAAQSEGVKR